MHKPRYATTTLSQAKNPPNRITCGPCTGHFSGARTFGAVIEEHPDQSQVGLFVSKLRQRLVQRRPCTMNLRIWVGPAPQHATVRQMDYRALTSSPKKKKDAPGCFLVNSQ